MGYFVDQGAAVWVEWNSPEHLHRVSCGQEFYGTVTGAALHGGANVTAFERSLEVEKVYNGFEAMATWPDLPEPTGVRSKYRVSVLNGVHYHPALHPNDAMKLSNFIKDSDTSDKPVD